MSNIQNSSSRILSHGEKARIRKMADELASCYAASADDLRLRARSALAVLTSMHDKKGSRRTSDRYLSLLSRLSDTIDSLEASDPEKDLAIALALDQWISERDDHELTVIFKLALLTLESREGSS